MRRVIVPQVLLILLFLTMVFVGCSTDTENPASSSLDKNDLTQLTQEQQALLASLPKNFAQREMDKLAEVFPGQITAVEQQIDPAIKLSPGGTPLGNFWISPPYIYMRVYSPHFGACGPKQPKGATHMNFCIYKTDKFLTDQDRGGNVKELANIHVSYLKQGKSSYCLYIYDNTNKKDATYCIDPKWPSAKQTQYLVDSVMRYIKDNGVIVLSAVSTAVLAAIVWVISALKFLPVL